MITLGIMGGGQLGCMLSNAAKKLNIKTIIYCDDDKAPARFFADEVYVGDYNDEKKILNFANNVDIITFEFENIPYKTLSIVNKIKRVLPDPAINKLIQNRLSEKDFLNKCNLRTTQYNYIKSKKDLNASASNFFPGILKTCTLGYDGKGQYKINSLEEVSKINIDYNKEYILEKLINLKLEISVILTRYGHQKFEVFEPIENKHEDQILRVSSIPANISESLFIKSIEWASIIAEELNFIGTMCVEFFIDKNDNLYVNEIAPRVHNSGHLTINSHNISQFECHIRAVCGLEKIKIKKLFNAKMINLIGDDINLFKNKSYKEGEFFFDYLKQEIKDNRKMGHFTKIFK